MLIKISKGYQLTIPAEIRNKFGIKPGTDVDLNVEGTNIILTPMENVDILELFKKVDKFKAHKLEAKDLEKIEDDFY